MCFLSGLGWDFFSPSPPALGIPSKVNMAFFGFAEIKRFLQLHTECSHDFCEKEIFVKKKSTECSGKHLS